MKKRVTNYPCRRTVRITRAEDEKLREFAAKVGIPVSEYMRRLFFGGRPIIAKTDDQAIKELRRLGGLLKHHFIIIRESGQTSNGYGRYKVIDHSYRELDLLKPEDMQIWLNTGYGDLPEKDVAHARKLPEPVPLDGEKRLYGDISLPLVCDEPILIGGGSPMPGDGREADADILFALSPWLNYEAKELQWRWAIPGSSLKGVFRHAVYNILRDLGLSEYDAKERLKNLFGHEKDGGQCGKLRFEDCLLADNHPGAIIQHVSIDRFTGGAVKGALFNEEPLWQPGLKLRPRLHVAGADAKEAALVFHALLDLAAGLLSVGNGANRGNGRLAPPVGTPPLNLLAGDLRWKGSPILGEQNSANFEKALEDWDLELMEEMNL